MDIPDTVSVRRFREFNDKQKEELYETLLELSESVQELPKKSLRKTLELTLAVLEFKGEQVEQLQQSQAQAADERRLAVENDKLKDMLAKLQDEQETYKNKIKTLTEEILQLQQSLQEAAQRADASDKDSSDPLSELDKHEELLRNINAKNKHIKRLLRDMEALQNQTIEQSKSMVRAEAELKDMKEKLLQLSKDITIVDKERTSAQQRIHEQGIEITRLEGNINYLEEERDKTELETKQLVQKLEAKILAYKNLLEERDKELKQLRLTQTPSTTLSSSNAVTTKHSESDSSSGSSEEKEVTKLQHLLEVRERHIEKLETKIQKLGEDMMASTQLMNRMNLERAQQSTDPKQPRACCKAIEDNLRAITERCQQLAELLERSEEDNLLKSKQALHAIAALDAYKSGKDGLVPALRKCAALEQKLAARDKQLRTYVTELNSMHEIIQENRVLRRRLKIPDDVVVTAKNLLAKERNKDKMIERLTLKLRTSEELRLQLKLEKSQLRKELLSMEQRQGRNISKSTPSSVQSSPSEIGEVPDSSPVEYIPHACGQCRGQGDGAASTELQTKVEEVLAENETLRTGMYEILEKLREYDANSEHITIDAALLKQVIDILPNRQASGVDTPKRLQLEVQELKAREEALRVLLQEQQQQTQATDVSFSETGELSSSTVQSLRDVPEMPKEHVEVEMPEQEPLNTATRPTSPNVELAHFNIPEITEPNPTELRELQQEIAQLRIYRKHYEELQLHLAADGDELKRYNHELSAQLTVLELQLQQQGTAYEYMRSDYDQLLSTSKQQEIRYINDTAALRRQLIEGQLLLKELQAARDSEFNRNQYSDEEYQQLAKRNMVLSMQLAYIVGEVLTGKLDDERLVIRDICAEFGVIQENGQLDYIPANEYEKQRLELSTWQQQKATFERKNQQLEGLLEVANEQIQSQQKLLNEITDNHINLRHLVADLQSSSEEKLLLAKIQRDLDNAKTEITRIESERKELQLTVDTLREQLKEAQKQADETQKDFQTDRNNKELKIKFLQKSLFLLREKYAKFTPLIFLTNFVFAYTKFINKQTADNGQAGLLEELLVKAEPIVQSHLAEHALSADASKQIIKLIKAESHTKMVEAQYECLQTRYTELQRELGEIRLRQANESEHWQTIGALFGGSEQERTKPKEAQQDVGVNTETPQPAVRKSVPAVVPVTDKQTSPIASPVKDDVPTNKNSKPSQLPSSSANSNLAIGIEVAVQTTQPDQLGRPQNELTHTAAQTNGKRESSHQSVQTLAPEKTTQVTQTANAELQQMQEALQDAKSRIAELERMNDESKAAAQSAAEETAHDAKSDVIEKTILSFHTLLMEKDTSITKYQDLLQTEREQHQFAITKLTAENETLRNTVNNLNFNIKTKDVEILEMKAKLEVLSMQSGSKNQGKVTAEGLDSDESGDNSLNELTDEKIEEMFEDTASVDRHEAPAEVGPITIEMPVDEEKEKQDTEELKEIPTLHKQIKELKDNVAYCESTLRAKEEEISIIKEKIKLCEEREKAVETTPSPEIEQLRAYLEEKDKHINDLMETLKNFHDDQQVFMHDTSTYSADQIAKLAADVNRTEATNKIYQTQVEALRRQVSNLTQREKQTRELNQSLRNQLIKRPVVSIKTELNARVKNENLQKRVQQLETELDDSRKRLQRQQTLLDARRARSANEVGLWEKQKRWQQNAEKCKAKLDETETALEKTRALLQGARTTIARLEKDKQIMESKLHRASHSAAARNHSSTNNINAAIKCCRTPSCPNLQHVGIKYTPTPSESPETYTGGSSECSSPARHSFFDHNQPELLEALKARIELQQRKIIAMELEGKGTNALTTEMEKLQERCQSAEAQNIRLEARNLQLQLDIDLLRQSDASDRMQKRIKHLEDYIIALKEEMARMDSRRELCKCSGVKVNTQQGQSAEQTILSLRNLVEKLRAENKYLKDGRRSTDSRSSLDAPTDVSRLQQMYSDAMERISVMQQELNAKTKCSICNGRGGKDALNEELKFIKEQLIKKTQLLQKAKILLTRAAAKEKVLKEQLMLWKRKCSELQNVPVIEETSE